MDLGEEELPSDNLSLRVAAAGLSNVNDPEGLRIVQWDCDWQRPRLAGQYETAEEGTFAVNGYVVPDKKPLLWGVTIFYGA